MWHYKVYTAPALLWKLEGSWNYQSKIIINVDKGDSPVIMGKVVVIIRPQDSKLRLKIVISVSRLAAVIHLQSWFQELFPEGFMCINCIQVLKYILVKVEKKLDMDYLILSVKGIFKLLVHYGGRLSNYCNYFFYRKSFVLYVWLRVFHYCYLWAETLHWNFFVTFPSEADTSVSGELEPFVYILARRLLSQFYSI